MTPYYDIYLLIKIIYIYKLPTNYQGNIFSWKVLIQYFLSGRTVDVIQAPIADLHVDLAPEYSGYEAHEC